MAGIQLIGIEHVIDAFNDFDQDTWALFQGKQLLIAGVGVGTLEAWLERFLPAGSTGTYTLRIYDGDLPVKASTEYVAALNFKLQDDYGGRGINGHRIDLLARIGELEKKLDDDSDEGEGITDILIGWLKDPAKLDTAIGAIMQLSGRQAPGNVPAGSAPVAQAINGFQVASDQPQYSDDKLSRLEKALDRLEQRDPKIIEYLEKFAAMDDLTFSLVTSKLNAL